MASIPIVAARTISGNQPEVDRKYEDDGVSFLIGVPLQIEAADGGLEEWAGDPTSSPYIVGVSMEAGANLTTAGVPKTLTFGSVPNQTNAVNIPRGAPLNDGRSGFYVGNLDTVFHGQCAAASTMGVTDIGKQYGLTKDTDNHWYVDKTKTTVLHQTDNAGSISIVGTTCVVITDIDEYDTRGCYFKFVPLALGLVGV